MQAACGHLLQYTNQAAPLLYRNDVGFQIHRTGSNLVSGLKAPIIMTAKQAITSKAMLL